MMMLLNPLEMIVTLEVSYNTVKNIATYSWEKQPKTRQSIRNSVQNEHKCKSFVDNFVAGQTKLVLVPQYV